MAWSFRRRIKLGPINVNLSRSGIGLSAGLGPIRTGVDAKGRRYTNVRGPFGLYSRQYHTPDTRSTSTPSAEDIRLAAAKDAVWVLLFSILVFGIAFSRGVSQESFGWLVFFALVTAVPAVIGILTCVSGKEMSRWLELNAMVLKAEKWLIFGVLLLVVLLAASGKRRRG